MVFLLLGANIGVILSQEEATEAPAEEETTAAGEEETTAAEDAEEETTAAADETTEGEEETTAANGAPTTAKPAATTKKPQCAKNRRCYRNDNGMCRTFENPCLARRVVNKKNQRISKYKN